jgi:hypothetical protein
MGCASTVALGIAMQKKDRRVLLIDGDMHRPQLHKVFDLANSWGLSDILREKNAIEDLPTEVLVKKTKISGLYLLPSGVCARSDARMLASGIKTGRKQNQVNKTITTHETATITRRFVSIVRYDLQHSATELQRRTEWRGKATVRRSAFFRCRLVRKYSARHKQRSGVLELDQSRWK